MFICGDQNAGENNSIKVGNNSFENVEHFIYFEANLKGENCIHQEIKSRSKFGNAEYFVFEFSVRKYKD
jgi:hypothetical protein